MNYFRVVYGETLPAWERIFATKAEADAFAKKHESFGDIIFSITEFRSDDPPLSLEAALKRIRDR